MAILTASNLDVRIRERMILHHVSFSTGPGVFVVLGPNGCGKTSLLRSLGGIASSTPGCITIDGEPISSMSRQSIAKHIAYVPQEHHPSFGYTVEELVLMGRTPYVRTFGFPTSTDRDIASFAMERLGVRHLRDRLYTNLSGGERRLALIAMSICQQSRIIMLDEPTAFLDAGNSFRIINIIRELAVQDRKTVITAMHEINHASICADTLLMIKSSEDIVIGAPSDLLTEQNLSNLYGVRFEILRSQHNKVVVVPFDEQGY